MTPPGGPTSLTDEPDGRRQSRWSLIRRRRSPTRHRVLDPPRLSWKREVSEGLEPCAVMNRTHGSEGRGTQQCVPLTRLMQNPPARSQAYDCRRSRPGLLASCSFYVTVTKPVAVRTFP